MVTKGNDRNNNEQNGFTLSDGRAEAIFYTCLRANVTSRAGPLSVLVDL